MRVLFVCSEAYPLVKTGGLADVAGALPPTLAGLGTDARIMLPAYPEAREKAVDLGEPVPLGDPLGLGEVRLVPGRMPDSGCPLWLVDCPPLFDRPGGPYQGEDGNDWHDNHLRFGILARAAAKVARAGAMMGWQPDLVHANDWQTGLAPAYIAQSGGRPVPTVFTIHNIHYRGLFGPDVMGPLGLLPELFNIGGIEFHGLLSFLKAGLRYSSRIVAVSPTYAKEIREPEMAEGFHGLLAGRGSELRGILNGVDYGLWNPETDPALPAPYSAADMAGKAANKKALLEEFGLPADPDAPLIGVVSRMTHQKGLDLVLDARQGIFDLGARMVLLGSGDPELEQGFRAAAAEAPGSLGVRIGYDEALAHRIEAGCDMLLVPSRFEPCGLTQLYALRYGTLPVVRYTGGLADTVVDVSDPGNGTGFQFGPAFAHDLYNAVARAVELYENKEKWGAVQRRAMEQDFSWQKAAQRYLALYREIA